MIVIDASVLVPALIGSSSLIPDRIAGEDCFAPHVIDAEVGNALRRMVRTGRLDETRAERSLLALREIEIVRYAHAPLLSRAWGLRNNLTFYDALYLALAEALDAPLLTLDSAFAAVPGSAAIVEVAPPI